MNLLKSITVAMLVVTAIGLFFYSAQTEREAIQAQKTEAGIGEREHHGCFQYGDQEYCEVWVKTERGMALCYRVVPTSIPIEDIQCHE